MSANNWVLKYAGVNLPAPVKNGLNIELQPIDSAERNASGDLMIEEVALKRKISITWSSLKGSEASTIISLLANNRTGELEYYDVANGGVFNISVYYGAGAKLSYLRFDDEMNKQLYTNLTVNFIEA
jgi:hypothetical protein